jgi:hypothetical protein
VKGLSASLASSLKQGTVVRVAAGARWLRPVKSTLQ